MRFLLGDSYTKRPVPVPAEGNLREWAKLLVAWLTFEFGNIQRALAPATSRTITASATLTVNDNLVLVDATAGNVSVTLLAPANVGDRIVTIKRIDSSGNTVTIVGTVDNAVNPTLAQWKAKTIWAYAPAGGSASWFTVATV